MRKLMTTSRVKEIMEICQKGSGSNCEHVISSILKDIATTERERILKEIGKERTLQITKIPIFKRLNLVYSMLCNPKLILNMHRLVVLDLLYQRVRNLKWTDENRH